MECLLCKKNVKEIDFRETDYLKRYITALGKIRPKQRTGLCATHQRRMSHAVKRARHLGLLSPSSK